MGVKLWGPVLKPAEETHGNDLSWAKEGLSGLTAPIWQTTASEYRKSSL